jgi:arginine exporter protein ArgO
MLQHGCCERMTWGLEPFLQGMIAGYGIAIPVGPIAILIIELGIRRGFSFAFCAGAGAASADLIYATIASVAGTFLVATLEPFSPIIRVVSGLALIAMGAWLLYQGRSSNRPERIQGYNSTSCLNTYGMILGLTLMNPVTVTYFTTLILGLKTSAASSPTDVLLFVAGAFLASLSWQTFLACISGLTHKRLPPRLQSATFAVGNSMIIVLGILILLGSAI